MDKESNENQSKNKAADREPTKAELERQMEETRESLSQTVQEIKDTVSEQVASVKETVGGVLDYREQFQKEPMVWSLGALSAGFALGYTLGYAHKNIKGSRKNQRLPLSRTHWRLNSQQLEDNGYAGA